MQIQQNLTIILISAVLVIIILLVSACTNAPSPVQAPPPVSPPVRTVETPAAGNLTTVHGTVQDLYMLNCPCFTLVTGTGGTRVWYDLMVGPDGTSQPAVAIGNLSNGDEVLVTGTRQAGGDIWAEQISRAPPRIICNCPMEPAGSLAVAPAPTTDDGLCHCP